MTRQALPYVVMAFVVAVCLLIISAGLVRNRDIRQARASATQSAALARSQVAGTPRAGGQPMTGAAPSTPPPGAASSTPEAPFRVIDSTPVATPPAVPAPLSQQAPGDISLSEVSQFTGAGGSPVLVMRDGSRLNVTPDVRDRLPGDVQLRLSYQRDR